MAQSITTNKDTNLRDSLIRTYAPIAAGYVIAYITTKGIDFPLDDKAMTAILTALWYTLWRVLETKVPELGWALGMAKQPAYSPKDAPPAQPAPGESQPNFLEVSTYLNDDKRNDPLTPAEIAGGDHGVPAELLELHEILEWDDAVRSAQPQPRRRKAVD